MSRKSVIQFGLVAAALVVIAAVAFFLPPDDEQLPAAAPPVYLSTGDVQGFVSSNSCRECHPRYYDTWHASYHRRMTQEATPEAVVAPFDGVELRSRDYAYELDREGDQFFARSTEPGTDQERYPVVLTTGSHTMQTYWMPKGDRLHQLPWFFHIEEQMWIPTADTFLFPPDAGLAESLWNDTCIECHSTGHVPGFDKQKGFRSRVAELGIACEACHGPGDAHVRFHKGNSGSAAAASESVAMVNPATLPHKLSSHVCAQCHSFMITHDRDAWLQDGSPYRSGDDLATWYDHPDYAQIQSVDARRDPDLASYLDQGYWKDGTCRVGGDEFLGMSSSACFQNGTLSCVSCHSMHDSDPTDQLRAKFKGNEACLQCHDEYRDRIEQHTHHAIGSSGSLCYNCHMPHTSYALLKAIRSHRIDSPRTGHSSLGGRPNACNLCHLDRPLQWTATHLSEWYGVPPVEMSETDQQQSAALLWLLRGDAFERAVLAWAMGWEAAHEASGSDWQAPFLAETMLDPYSAVRFVAWRSLKQLPEFAGFEFDFLGTDEQLAADRRRVLEKWEALIKPLAADFAARVLLTPEGRVNKSALREIQIQRDNRPVEIPE